MVLSMAEDEKELVKAEKQSSALAALPVAPAPASAPPVASAAAPPENVDPGGMEGASTFLGDSRIDDSKMEIREGAYQE